MNSFNAMLINPHTRSIHAISMHETNQLAQLYQHIQCHLVTATDLANGDTAWLDDEGLFVPDQTFFMLPGLYEEPLAGICVITGARWDEQGDHLADCQSNLSILLDQIVWLSRHQLRTLLAQ